MKNLQTKLTGIMIALIIVALIVPIQVFATNEDLQIVYFNDTDSEGYIIYIDELSNAESGFDFAISTSATTDEMDLSYTNSVTDSAGNQVALITGEKYNTIVNDTVNTYFLHIKNGENVTCKELNFDEAFNQEKLEEVKTTTGRISTEIVKDIVERDEVENGIHYTTTVGGLKITDIDQAKYQYTITKLPKERYSELKELADKINNNFNDMTTYDQIKTAKEFYNLYTELKDEQSWLDVENMTVKQPDDAVIGDEYIVFLKKVDEDGTETVDVKFMLSDRAEKEDQEKAGTETRETKRTSKLPITGDSITLFVILAVIVIVAIIVFIRMKKLSKKESKN